MREFVFSDLKPHCGKDGKGREVFEPQSQIFPRRTTSCPGTPCLSWSEPWEGRERSKLKSVLGNSQVVAENNNNKNTVNPDLDTRASRNWTSSSSDDTLEIIDAAWIEWEWPGMWGGTQLSLPESLNLGQLFLYFYCWMGSFWRQDKDTERYSKKKGLPGTLQFFCKRLAIIWVICK